MSAATARADCTSPSATIRVTRLESAMLAEGARARTWRFTWGAINEVSALSNFALMGFVDRSERADWALSGAGAILNTAFTLGMPLAVESSGTAVFAASQLEPCARLRRDEALYARYASDERARASWPWHLVNLATAAAFGSLLGFGLHHEMNGLLTGLGAAGLGELQLFTQPTGLSW